jgi:hypothetical protein
VSDVGNKPSGATTKFGKPFHVGSIGADAPRFLAPVAGRRARSDGVGLLKLGPQQHMGAFLGAEGCAEGDGCVRIFSVAFGRLTIIDLRLEAFEVSVEDHIDHAGDGVGAVSRRCAAGHDFCTCHEHRRDEREIDPAALGVRNDTLGVDERQRAGPEERVEPAQVSELRADVEVTDSDVRLGEKRRVLRQSAHDLADVDDAETLDLGGIDDRERLRRIEAAALDARSRDDDLLETRFLGDRYLCARHGSQEHAA